MTRQAKATCLDEAHPNVEMSSGFSTIVQEVTLAPGTIDLIQKSSVLNGLFASQARAQDHDAGHNLMRLAKEVNFRCNDILLRRHARCLEKVIVLGLSCHCHYIANRMTQRFNTPRMGLGVSILLPRMACMSLARDYGLDTALQLESPAVRNAMVWAGSILLATSSEGDPAWSLGRRLLRLCRVDHTVSLTMDIEICCESFPWPETLRLPFGTDPSLQ